MLATVPGWQWYTRVCRTPTGNHRTRKSHHTHEWIPPGIRRLPIPPFNDKRSQKSFIRTNDRIRAREVRVIDENGDQLGVMQPFEALRIARERSLDLVEISPNAVPPVCKIQDYGKVPL